MAVAKGPLEGGREGGREREGGLGIYFFFRGLAIYACVCVSCKLLTKCFKTLGESPRQSEEISPFGIGTTELPVHSTVHH